LVAAIREEAKDAVAAATGKRDKEPSSPNFSDAKVA
jgi:hypothetical protein